jgi:hypothetical protein
MKKVLLLASLFVTANLFAQTPGIAFKETKHSFGKIKQNVPATYVFSFTNNLAKPALVEVATAECGCTTPVYSKEPIAKGKTSTIKVTYNAASMGSFTKKVTVKFLNVPEPVILTIDGEVIPAKAAAKTK